jgi:predicted phosphoribosyltransferase
MIFRDRLDAGQKLAELVAKKVAGKGLVLGIPRGGVVLAKIVADKLGWPLDVIRAKKITSPENPELAVGAEVRPPWPKLKSFKQIIVVDDGVATGSTLEAAIIYLKGLSIRVIVAVPVAAKDSAQRLKPLVDQWLCLFEPDSLEAVGQYYQEFGQVSDEEVLKLLHEANRRFGQSGQ